ncbi:MAG: glycosyltransferase [Actinobacteria bacterium]|nr:glycosyltransferase [Actinomycetota bacterium]
MPERGPVGVVITAKGESPQRLARLLDAVTAQSIDRPIEVVIAHPPEDPVVTPEPRGPIESVRLVDNPGGGRSTGLNLAIEASTAEVLCRLDARTVPPPDYLARCVARLEADPTVGMVGGVQSPVPGASGVVARGVARALANPWALGAPAYRRTSTGGAVDTVYLGAFRRSEVLAVGGYDVRLDANEDFDLAQRLRDRGLVVWLEAELVVPYEARTSIGAVWQQYLAFGRSKMRFWRVTGRRPNGRQVLALTAAGAGVAAAVIWVRDVERAAVVVLGGLAAAAAVDHLADPSERSPAVRAATIAANGAAIGAWLSGVVVEAVRPARV